MYALSWGTFFCTHSSVIFVFIYPLVSTETVLHSSTYIILYVNDISVKGPIFIKENKFEYVTS